MRKSSSFAKKRTERSSANVSNGGSFHDAWFATMRAAPRGMRSMPSMRTGTRKSAIARAIGKTTRQT